MTQEPTAVAVVTQDPCPHCGQEIGDAWLVCGSCGEQIAAPAELALGTRLDGGRYQVLGVIGRGGFGITYEVGDRRLERRVAVKELFPESAVRHGSMVLTPPQARPGFRDARDRFLREARVLARFSHTGIVRVFEVFEEHGTAYLVMELLDGKNLVDLLRLRGRPFSEAEVVDVAARVAAALRPVHAAGVLHRDVNPSNVMLTRHGRIVVIDFGLARDFDQSQTRGMTRVVTPGYAPLEQYRGEARFGPATDVYGLAATCYRLVTGRVPVAAVDRDGGAELPAPRTLNPSVSKAVSDAILDGLELEPSHRPQDLDSFLARLGVRRLPDGPRSVLLDAVGDLGPTVATPGFASVVEPTGATRTEAPSPNLCENDTHIEPISHKNGDGAELVRERHAYRRDLAQEPTRLGPADLVPMAPDLTRTVAQDPPRRPQPLTMAAAPPGADVRLPVAVGPHRPGRRKVTVPLVVLAVAVGGAAPVLATALVVLVVLPSLATFGDSVAHRLRAEHGVAGGWAERRLSPGALAPARFARNVMASVVRSSPVVGVAAALLAGWYALSHTSLPASIVDGALRLIGATAVGLIAAASREGSSRFRTGLGLDEIVARSVPDGRTNQRVVVFWLIVALLVAGAFWLAPDPFPLP
ncbi:MAG: serine/threonine-protein kinase [Acidimicrobiales bacterium]